MSYGDISEENYSLFKQQKGQFKLKSKSRCIFQKIKIERQKVFAGRRLSGAIAIQPPLTITEGVAELTIYHLWHGKACRACARGGYLRTPVRDGVWHAWDACARGGYLRTPVRDGVWDA